MRCHDLQEFGVGSCDSPGYPEAEDKSLVLCVVADGLGCDFASTAQACN